MSNLSDPKGAAPGGAVPEPPQQAGPAQDVNRDDILRTGISGEPETGATAIGEGNVPDQPSAAGSRSQASRLVDLAEAAGVIPFRTPDNEPYVVVPVSGHLETYRVNSRRFQTWLRMQHYRQLSTALHGSVIAEATATIESKALFDGEEHPVSVRMAALDGKVYLDLADSEWRVVEIEAGSWRLLNQSPIRFTRPNSMRPLPQPLTGGAIDELRDFINLDDDDFKLVVGWLIGTFQVDRPFSILALHGEQGSGKTTQATMLRSLVDPVRGGLRGFPREEVDLIVAATNSWIVGFDNVSTLSPWLSDALCRLSTGAAFGRRQLYTDADEVIFEVKRPLLLNGIEEVTIRGDVADRAVPISLPRIPESRRRTEAALHAAYEAARPRLLGGLLDVVAGILLNLPNTVLREPPRMADFARWVTAGEPALGWPRGSFMQVYAGNREGASTTVIESSSVASSIRELVSITKGNVLWGTAKELLDRLNQHATDQMQRQRDWPKDAKTLSGTLRRISPALRAIGIEVETSQTSGAGSKKLWTFRGKATGGSDATDATDAENGNGVPPLVGDASQPASQQASQAITTEGGETGRCVASVASVAENPRESSAPVVHRSRRTDCDVLAANLVDWIRAQTEHGRLASRAEGERILMTKGVLTPDGVRELVNDREGVQWTTEKVRLPDDTFTDALAVIEKK